MREDYAQIYYEQTLLFEETKEALIALRNDITNNYEGPIPLKTEQITHD